jgi:subfamily B ATP-binding cassette protein MsbA
MSYFASDRALIAVLVLLIGISVFVGLLEAWPLAVLIDTVLTREPKGGWTHQALLSFLPEDKLGQVIAVVLVGAGLQIVGYSAWLGRMMINYHLNYRGTARVRYDLFTKLQEIGLTYHRSHPQGDGLFRLSYDVLGPWGIVDLVIGTAVAAVVAVIMASILLSINTPLALAALSIAPFMIASNWFFGRRIHTRTLDSKQADTDLMSFTQQALATMGLAQAFRREPHEFARYQGWIMRSIRAALRLNWQEQLYPFTRDVMLAVAGAIIFGYGGYLVYRDQFAAPIAGGMTVGVLFVFVDYTRKLWDPLKWLTEFVAKVQFHIAASRRVFAVLDAPVSITEAPNAKNLPLLPRTLTLDRVGFSYHRGQRVLQDISAQIQPGEMVAFVGPSGTGKSTLLSLMMRFYDPTEGALRLNGIDFRDVRIADLRGQMALVGQDSIMLPVSIAENIGYGCPGATRAQIARAAQMAGAADFIASLEEGYDTLLTEGGQNLSGGQRQRIAIARALVSEAPFLILDEPTSALDPHHEQRLVRTLCGLKGRRTIVLVTHRLASVVKCDSIFVVDGGRIVERGSHQQLLEQGGTYASMWHSAAYPGKHAPARLSAAEEPLPLRPGDSTKVLDGSVVV